MPVLNEVFSNNIEQGMGSGDISLGLIPAGSTNVRIRINDNGANDDINLFTQNGDHLVGQDLSSVQDRIETNLFTPANGYQGTETYSNGNLFQGGGYNFPAVNSQTINGMNFTYSGNGNPSNLNEEVIIDSVTEPLLLTVIGSGFFNITASWDTLGSLNSSSAESSDGPMLVTSTDRAIGEEGYIMFEDIDASAGSLTIDGITISSENLAQNAITRIDTALSRIGGFRAEIGAKINAIESTIRNESNQSLMLSSANQRIEDTDFAKVMAEKISLDIVQQAGVSVAMQARNITKEGILSLLGQLE
ncbi:flagellin [Pseudoalteromonas lipolytica]